MNASANLRASIIRASVLPLPYDRTNALQQRQQRQRRRTVQVVNYPEYKARCDLERNAPLPSLIEEYTGDSTIEASRWEQFQCMFTVFPYKDMNWVIAIMFVAGSISFTINAFFGLLHLLVPSTAFKTEATVALPATITLGAIMFLTAGTLGVFAAFNADRGTFETDGEKTLDGVPTVYRPALLGSSAWAWWPSAPEIQAVLRTVPFRSGLMQLSGGIIFSIAAGGGRLLVFFPQVIGGSLFLIANVMLAIFVQDRWYKPKPLDADWQGSLWGAIGSVGFLLAGILLLLSDPLGSAIAAFIGSLVQWYALMEFHRTPWAG